MIATAQAFLGILFLAALWWGVLALIRLFEPVKASGQGTPGSDSPGHVVHADHVPPGLPRARVAAHATAHPPCCPDCTPGCQLTGLASGQAWGRGDDWWGQPFGDEGPNTQALVFWGDECCPDCATCSICHGRT